MKIIAGFHASSHFAKIAFPPEVLVHQIVDPIGTWSFTTF